MEDDLQEHLDPPHYSLRYERELRAGALLVHCRGGFALNNHALMDMIVSEIKAAEERKIVLDFGGIRYIDSVGVGTLAAILKHTLANGIDLVIVSNEIVDKMLTLSGMDRLIPTAPSVEEVLRKPTP